MHVKGSGRPWSECCPASTSVRYKESLLEILLIILTKLFQKKLEPKVQLIRSANVLLSSKFRLKFSLNVQSNFAACVSQSRVRTLYLIRNERLEAEPPWPANRRREKEEEKADGRRAGHPQHGYGLEQ